MACAGGSPGHRGRGGRRGRRAGDQRRCGRGTRSRLPAPGRHTGQPHPRRRRAAPGVGPEWDTGPGWAHIAAGEYHACGIRTGGTLWCWGWNVFGQLGLGNQTNQDRPQQVTTPAPRRWASVTAGFGHTCATRTGGTLWCWGFNALGQLGLGNHTDQDRPQQVTTPGRGGWASVTAGGGHTCATRTGGTLWCWGFNVYGQLGIGNTTGQDLPQQVTTPTPGGWASVAAGDRHTCATLISGKLWCWGGNGYGQLGIGSDVEQDLPRQVTTPAPRGWASLTAGSFHTCATRTGGTLWCWGWNVFGQLGLGNHTEQDRPRQVSGCAHPGTLPRAARASRSRIRRPSWPHPADPSLRSRARG